MCFRDIDVKVVLDACLGPTNIGGVCRQRAFILLHSTWGLQPGTINKMLHVKSI